MKATIKNAQGCVRVIDIEVNQEELKPTFDQVYADIRKTARVPGYRPGFAPRDLLETHYSKTAEEEVIKRAVPSYYIKAMEEQKLQPVAPPEIENIQYKGNTLSFSARVDIRPKPKLKSYKGISIKKEKKEITQVEIDQTIERLRQSRALPDKDTQEKKAPELNDAFAQELGLKTMEELKDAVKKNLHSAAETQVQQEMERQLLEELLKRSSLDTPASLVQRQTKEILEQVKMNHILQGTTKEEIEKKAPELEQEAKKEAERRVNLSFILEEIAQRENIQVREEDIDSYIAEVAKRYEKNADEVKHYFEHHNLIAGIKDELLTRKTVDFLMKEAHVEER